MSNPDLPPIAEAAQGGASPPVADPFHDQLNDMCDERIAKIKQKDPPAEAAPAEIIRNVLVGEMFENFQPEKLGKKHVPFETVYNSQLTPGTSRNLISGDTLDITRKGSQVLVMPDNGRLYISPSTGEIKFEKGKMDFEKSVDAKTGVTTLKFDNGDRVSFSQNGLVEIQRGRENVTFKDKPEGPERLRQALDKVDDKLTNAENQALRSLVKHITAGDMESVQQIAKSFHNNPESMIKVVNALNEALEAADIPRMWVRYSSTLDNHNGRSGELSIGVSHTWSKSSPWTNLTIRTSDNGEPQASASYHSGPFSKIVPIKPAEAGDTFSRHLVNPDFMNKQFFVEDPVPQVIPKIKQR